MSKSLMFIMLSTHMKMTRLALSLGSFLWCIQLALPIQTFPISEKTSAVPESLIYAMMGSIATEEIWSVLFGLHAVVVLYSIITDRRDAFTLVFDGFLGCLLWSVSTLSCYASYWPVGKPFFESLSIYSPPVILSGGIVMMLLAWWQMIRFWAEDPKPNKTSYIFIGENRRVL